MSTTRRREQINEIRIEIPPGQYAPRFVFQSAPTTLNGALVCRGGYFSGTGN